MSLTLHVTHVTNHLTEKQLFTRFSARDILYLATLVNYSTTLASFVTEEACFIQKKSTHHIGERRLAENCQCCFESDSCIMVIWVLQPVKIISLILSQVNRKVGRKQEIPEKSHLNTCKQNLACLKCDPIWSRTHR